MKLISVGIHEDVFELIEGLIEEGDLRVHNAESTFINVLLRKALGIDSGIMLDPLVDEVIEDLEENHSDHSECEICSA